MAGEKRSSRRAGSGIKKMWATMTERERHYFVERRKAAQRLGLQNLKIRQLIRKIDAAMGEK